MLMMTQELARLAQDDAVGSVALRGRHRHNRCARAKLYSDIALSSGPPPSIGADE
jgi:hypothetical protein